MPQLNTLRWNAKLQPHVFNWRPGYQGNMQKFTAALARMYAEGYRPKTLFLGTSKMMGAGAGTSDGTASTVGAAPKTKSKFACDMLAGMGLPVSRQSVWASNGLTTALYSNYETRLALGTDWAVFINANSSLAGGGFGSVSSTVTGTMSFAPEGVVDKVDVIYARRLDRGSFTVSDDVTVVGTVTQTNGTVGIARSSFNLTSRGSGKVINLNRTNAAAYAVDVIAIIAYDSQTPALEVCNVGRYGAVVADFLFGYPSGQPWTPYQTLGFYAPDITFMGIMANDMRVGTAVATWKANKQILITQALVSGSVVLVMESFGQPTESGGTWGNAATQAAYRDAMYQLATENDIPLIDENAIIGSYAQSGAAMYADSIHENAKADAILARTYAAMLAG